MPYGIDFATEFSSFRVNSKSDKYLSNTSYTILPMRYNKKLELEEENKDEEDIENLSPHSFFFKKGL